MAIFNFKCRDCGLEETYLENVMPLGIFCPKCSSKNFVFQNDLTSFNLEEFDNGYLLKKVKRRENYKELIGDK
jgi:DNA-directed RNA polymerase subunit RPC12/RpoP